MSSLKLGGGSPHAPKDIISYLSSFEDGTLVSLYVDEFTALTVFRSLRGLAKQYVMNLVLCTEAIPLSDIAKWTLPSAIAHHKAAIHKLKKLKIFETESNGLKIKLNANFQNCLKKVIFGASSKDMMYIDDKQQNKNNPHHIQLTAKHRHQHPKPEKLDRHAKGRWETMLNILVGIGDSKTVGTTKQNQATINLLIKVGLIRKVSSTNTNNNNNTLQITAEGFKFLFQDIHSQIWQIIIAYLQGVAQRGLNRKEVLMFLFKLSFLTLNKPYSTSSFSDGQAIVVQDLCGMGLLYQKRASNIFFYPTYLAKHLSTGHSLTKQERDDRGFIIVETTFKIYAYTSSHLQIRLLAKFIKLNYRLPNLVTGKITKQSVMDAVGKGIPVDLIIEYLEQYAHKLMKQNEPILPINVVDQMRLWESENKRMKIEPAFMICLIPTDQQFDEFIQVVTGRENDERATLLADNGAPDEIQQIIQNIDTFVNENNQILHKNEGDEKRNDVNVDDNKALKKLLDVTLPPLIMSLLDKMNQANEHTLKSRYLMTLQKYGYNDKQEIFTKNLNVNDMMKFSDDLCGIHLSKQDMINSSSKLLWSSKAEKTMVVTPNGRDVLKRHRSQKRAASASSASSQSLTPPNQPGPPQPPRNSHITPGYAPPSLPPPP